jgi:hypothetical protein
MRNVKKNRGILRFREFIIEELILYGITNSDQVLKIQFLHGIFITRRIIYATGIGKCDKRRVKSLYFPYRRFTLEAGISRISKVVDIQEY